MYIHILIPKPEDHKTPKRESQLARSARSLPASKLVVAHVKLQVVACGRRLDHPFLNKRVRAPLKGFEVPLGLTLTPVFSWNAQVGI